MGVCKSVFYQELVIEEKISNWNTARKLQSQVSIFYIMNFLILLVLMVLRGVNFYPYEMSHCNEMQIVDTSLNSLSFNYIVTYLNLIVHMGSPLLDIPHQ